MYTHFTVAANTDAPLGDILDALGSYKVLGHGVLTTSGSSATVTSIDFGGTTTTFADAPGTPTTAPVVPGSIAPDESVYAGWHQGGTPATPATISGAALNLGPDRSQVIKGYANNSANTNAKNVDLAEALRTGSYVVKSGQVSFQVPLFFEDANGDTKFATLRPAADGEVGTNTFGLGDQWVSSRAIGDLPANTPVLLGDLLSSIGSYKVLAFGVFSNAGGNGVVKSITWDGVKHVFDRASSTTSVRKTYPVKPTSKQYIYVYVDVKSTGGSVAGGSVRISNAARTIGTGTVGADGRVRIKLTKKLAKGKRTLRVNFDGGTTVKPSNTSYVIRLTK